MILYGLQLSWVTELIYEADVYNKGIFFSRKRPWSEN